MFLEQIKPTIHKTKLWIDDVRPAPDDSWDIARTYNEAIEKLKKFHYNTISFDHDLGDFREDGREMTGYDILMWVVERLQNDLAGERLPTQYNVHSANPVAQQRMNGVIERYLSS